MRNTTGKPVPHKNRANTYKRDTSSSRDVKSSKTRWTRNLLLLCLGVLIAVVFKFTVFPGATQKRANQDSQLEAQANLASRPPASPAPKGSTPAFQPTVVLPTIQVEFDTQQEQQRLLDAVEHALGLFPKNAIFLHIAALTYAEMLQTERATDLYERAVSASGYSTEVVVSYADILSQAGKYDMATDVLEKSMARNHSAPILFSTLGELYLQAGDTDKSLQLLLKANGDHPRDPGILMRLAQAQVQTGDAVEAEANARLAIELGQQDRAVSLALASALMRLDRKEEAMQVRSQLPALESKVSADDNRYKETFRGFANHSYSTLAAAYMGQGRAAEAENALLRSLDFDPSSVKSTTLLAELYYKLGRMDDSILAHQRLIQLQPNNPLNYGNLASLAASVGKLEMAEELLQQAVAVDTSGNSELALAQFEYAVGKLEPAASHAKSAVEKLQSADAYLMWIAVLRAQGNASQAMNALLKAREIAPNDPRLSQVEL